MPLAARELTVSYPGGRTALTAVTCALAPARVTAIVGPNGAGKSTLLRALAGVRRPDSGTAELDGRPVWGMRPRARARRIALAVQQPGVAFGFDARRVIAFGAEGAGAPKEAVDRAITRFELGELAQTPFDALSVGQRQRVSLARAFAQLSAHGDTTSDVYLLADEPASAMDPRHAAGAFRAIRALARSGVGVGLVLHDLSAAAALADDALLLTASGTVAAQGPADTILTADRLSELFQTPILRSEAAGVGPVIAQPI